VDQSKDRLDMNKMCQYLLRTPEGRVTFRSGGGECVKLSCSRPNPDNPGQDIVRQLSYAPEDGSFPCGQNQKGVNQFISFVTSETMY